MQGKKRYLALILFVLIGLVTFSFANPEEELEPIEETTSNVSEAPNKKEEEKKETTILQPLEQAEEAVEQAEENPTQQTIQNAITIIERVIEEEPIRESLIQRVEVAEEAIDVAALVQTVENMVKTATKHEDIDASETYFDNNNVEEEAQNMTEGPAKDNIADRIEYLNLVFADDSAPIISGIENGVTTKETRETMGEISLAYSISIHKSQGSEAKSVIIPLLDEHKCALFRRNLLYTGISRAKQHVILVSSKKTVDFCIQNEDSSYRNTLFAERLEHEIGF